MAAKETINRSMLLGTSAIAALGVAACNSSEGGGSATPAEIGVFGYVVGTPVSVISSTRGEGANVDFDQFEVTFNNAEGTDITITTPEGEEINFTEADSSTWIGRDDDLDIEMARLVSEDGDRLEVIIGTVDVPVQPDEDTENGNGVAVNVGARCYGDDCGEYDTEEQLAWAHARLDEQDTRDGFETYAVVGAKTDPENLPRFTEDVLWEQDVFYEEDVLYEEDVFYEEDVIDPDTGEVLHEAGDLKHAAGDVQFEAGVDIEFFAGDVRFSEGDLIEGKAFYSGEFLASVYESGEMVTDQAQGSTYVGINFADDTVYINMNGGYYYDDIDDVQEGPVVTAVHEQFGTFVQSVDPLTGTALTGFDTTTGTFLTGVTAEEALAVTGFDAPTGTFVTSVGQTNRTFKIDQVKTGEIVIGPVTIELFGIVESNFVVGVNPATGTAVTGIINKTTGEFVTAVDSTSASALTGIVDVETGTFVTDVNETSALALTGVTVDVQTDNGDFYAISMSGMGGPNDVSFDETVEYLGTLDGDVDIPDAGGTPISTSVAGEFGGAVFGPGAEAFDDLEIDDMDYLPSQGEILGATGTAGVFEANSNTDDPTADEYADVEIVGTFGADSCGVCGEK